MKIQVMGSGCPTCKKLHEITKIAVTEMGLTDQVEYLSGAEGMQALIEIGSMTSPILVVDETIVMAGFTSDVEKIKKAITSGKKEEKKASSCTCGGKC